MSSQNDQSPPHLCYQGNFFVKSFAGMRFVVIFALTKLLNNMDKKDSEKKDREQLILEAAIREFSTKGYDGARTASIAAEAGVTHAMLHYYFRTKEKLFERIFHDKLRYIMDMVFTPIVQSGGDIRERIRRGVIAHFNFLMENMDLPIFFITTLNAHPDLYDDVIEEMSAMAKARIKSFQDELDKAAQAGEIKPVSASMLVCDIVSLNIFPFLVKQILMMVVGYSKDEQNEFLRARMEENIQLILNRLS